MKKYWNRLTAFIKNIDAIDVGIILFVLIQYGFCVWSILK